MRKAAVNDLNRSNTSDNDEMSKLEKSDFYDQLVKGYRSNPTGYEKAKKNKALIGLSSKAKGIGNGETIEVTPRPKSVKEMTPWFKELPWDERITIARKEGTLVLLKNIDPEYTSGDVENIIYHVFDEQCTANMVQHTRISNPYCGQAFVIVRAKKVADELVKELHDRCLVLSNGRPLLGRIVNDPAPSNEPSTFVGHLSIDKELKYKSKDKRDAVSTSHFAQPNTLEFEMAMEWLTLQARSKECWKRLYKMQEDEIQNMKDQLDLK